jgi:hypothetical protein
MKATLGMKEPRLIPILSWFALIAGIGMFASILLAALDIGPSIMGGERVTRREWLHIAAPLVAVIGMLMLAVAYGLRSKKPWARHCAMAIPVLIVTYALVTGSLHLIYGVVMWRAIMDGTLLGVATGWYFYHKPNVVCYFANLSRAGS